MIKTISPFSKTSYLSKGLFETELIMECHPFYRTSCRRLSQECVINLQLLSKTWFNIIFHTNLFCLQSSRFRGMKMDKTIPLLHCRDYPNFTRLLVLWVSKSVRCSRLTLICNKIGSGKAIGDHIWNMIDNNKAYLFFIFYYPISRFFDEW